MGPGKLTFLDPMNHRLFLHCLLWQKAPRRSENPHDAMGNAPVILVLSGLFVSVNPVAVPFLPVKLEKPWEGR